MTLLASFESWEPAQSCRVHSVGIVAAEASTGFFMFGAWPPEDQLSGMHHNVGRIKSWLLLICFRLSESARKRSPWEIVKVRKITEREITERKGFLNVAYNVLSSLASCTYIEQTRINITKILRHELWYRPLVRSQALSR